MKKIVILICLLLIFSGCEKRSVDNNKSNNDVLSGDSDNIKSRKINFACDDLKNSEILFFDYTDLVLNNNRYSALIDTDKQYSNNQQCKLFSDKKIERVVLTASPWFRTIYFIDNKPYQISGDEFVLINKKYNEERYLMMTENNIKSFYYYSEQHKNGDTLSNYLALKDDGNVYFYTISNVNGTYKITASSEIYYDSKIYGKIDYFYFEKGHEDNDYVIILSKNGLYTNEEVETEECKKYEDIKCEYSLVLNKDYFEISDKIIYFNKDIMVDKDYNIYVSSAYINLRNVA